MPAFGLLSSSCGEHCFSPSPHPSTSSSTSLPLDSPLPVIQRLRVGVEFVRCFRNISGRLSTPILYCRAGVVFHPGTLYHPRQQSLNISFLLVIRPDHRHLIIIIKTSIVSHSLSPLRDQRPLRSSPTANLISLFLLYATQLQKKSLSTNTSEAYIWSVEN